MTRTFYCIQGFKPDGNMFNLELEWETRQPTKEGIYWAVSNVRPEPFIVEIKRDMRAYIVNDNELFPLSLFTHWLGPIPAPELPQGNN